MFFAHAAVREKNAPKSEGVNRIRDKVVALHELYIITARAGCSKLGKDNPDLMRNLNSGI